MRDRYWYGKEIAAYPAFHHPLLDQPRGGSVPAPWAQPGGRGRHVVESRRRGRRYTPASNNRLEPRRVEQTREKARRRRLEDIADWLRAVIEDGETAGLAPPGLEYAVETLASRVVFGPEHPRASDAAIIARKARLRTPQDIFRLLVQLGYWGEREDLDLLRYEIPVAFTKAAIGEAEGAHWLAGASTAPTLGVNRVYAFRRDRRPHEKAFSFERGKSGFTVGVHLASPALLMQPDGPLQAAAAGRACALALPDRFIPMFPAGFLDRIALKESESVPCLSLRLEFDRDFRLIEYAFDVRRVRIACALEWAEVDSRCAEDDGLRTLLELARRLAERRRKAGAVICREPRVEISLTPTGDIVLRRDSAEAAARLIYQELTACMNSLAARICTREGIAAVYRIQRRGKTSVLETSPEWDPAASYRQEQNRPRPILQVAPGPRDAVGVDASVPVTEPCRRYTDLLMNQQLAGLLGLERHGLRDAHDLRQALRHASLARTTADELIRKTNRYWLLRYLEPRIGDRLPGVILDVLSREYLVELEETRLRVTVPIGPARAFPPGTRVTVQLTRVSGRNDTIELATPSLRA